ncbi:RnfH family protein [Herbaspirillum seropedicae]|uniref:RnfH family protein n=1 Tax=Herbaspirillum seropedicae TaxID=964 RepID=UPI003FCE07F6
MADVSVLQVQLCYAAPGLQILRDLEVEPGCTIQQAILDSGLLRQHPAIDLSACKVGIFGKVKPLETPLRQHDRIEIYRPLIADPKQSRRRRALGKEPTTQS